MKDKKGYLPAHVAASRHCSPEKLRMLLAVNPGSLRETTADGETLMSLATSTATKSHPNYALIDELHRQHAIMSTAPPRSYPTTNGAPVTAVLAAARAAPLHPHPEYRHQHPLMTTAVSGSEPSLSSGDDSPLSRERLNSNDSNKTMAGWPSPPRSPPQPYHQGLAPRATGAADPSAPRKKRKSRAGSALPRDHGSAPVARHPAMLRRCTSGPPLPTVDDPVGLLLHFSQTATTTPAKESATATVHYRNGPVYWDNADDDNNNNKNNDRCHHHHHADWYRSQNHDVGGDEDGSSLPVNFAQV
jgi:hypothetical protein